MQNKYKTWLLKNARFLSIYGIEKHLDMPEGTLKKYIDGKRELPDKWQPIVSQWIKEFTTFSSLKGK